MREAIARSWKKASAPDSGVLCHPGTGSDIGAKLDVRSEVGADIEVQLTISAGDESSGTALGAPRVQLLGWD